jgi:hypothetical protein
VVRRPGQYQGKKETPEQFLERLQGVIQEAPQEFFMRWKVEVTSSDIARFRTTCLDPILENLCWWYEEVTGAKHTYPPPPTNWRHPYGVRNLLDEGGITDLDSYLDTGSELGLQRVDALFGELQVGLSSQP